MIPASFGSRTSSPYSSQARQKICWGKCFQIKCPPKDWKEVPSNFLHNYKILPLTKESGAMKNSFRINQNCLIPRTADIFHFVSQIRYFWIRYILLPRCISEPGSWLLLFTTPPLCAIRDFTVLFQQLT